MRDRYDDGGYSGGSMDRPALQKLLADVEARRIDVIVVYKVDRLTRSLADFAKLVEMFDKHDVSFVSVTQSFNTTTSMGRLTLNVLLSFAQFEREVTGERIRDKIAASKKKGMWMGGVVPLGYRVEDRALHIVEDHAEIVRSLFRRYLEAGSVVAPQTATRRRELSASRSGSMAQAARPAAACSAGGISTRSCRTRSMSGASPIRARFTKDSIRRSWTKTCGTRSSKAWAIIWEQRGQRERANRPRLCSRESCSTIAATG